MSLIRIGNRHDNNSDLREKIGQILRNTSAKYGISLDRRRSSNNRIGFEGFSLIEEFPPDRMLKIGTFVSVHNRDEIAIKMLSSSRVVRSVRSLSPKALRDLENEFLTEVSGMKDFSIKRKSTEYLVIWEKSRSNFIC